MVNNNNNNNNQNNLNPNTNNNMMIEEEKEEEEENEVKEDAELVLSDHREDPAEDDGDTTTRAEVIERLATSSDRSFAFPQYDGNDLSALISATNSFYDEFVSNNSIDEAASEPSIPYAQLSSKQKETLTIIAQMKNGDIVMVLGTAGSGKSLIIQHVLKIYSKRKVIVCAPTGNAAFLVGGCTIHSLFHIKPKGNRNGPIGGEIAKEIKKKFEGKEFLIIEEASMASKEILMEADQVLRECFNKKLTFGGLKVIFFGDFRQLPPVVGRPAFEFPPIAEEKNFKVCLLPSSFRQTDEEFKNLLDKISKGRMDEAGYRYMETKFSVSKNMEKYKSLKNSKASTICAENKDVNEVNLNVLIQHTQVSNGKIFKTKARSSKVTDEGFIYLALDAEVVLTSNVCSVKGLSNGAAGTLRALVYRSDAKIGIDSPEFALVHFKDRPKTFGWLQSMRLQNFLLHSKYDYLQNCFPIRPISGLDENNFFDASSYLPLRLRWANTMHKAQGMTLLEGIVRFSKSTFSTSLVFVALSRFRNPDSVVVEPVCFTREFMITKVNESYAKNGANVDNKYAHWARIDSLKNVT